MAERLSVGQPTGGKPINPGQLQTELQSAGVDCSAGLGTHDAFVYTYDGAGVSADWPLPEQSVVDQVIAAHVGMRPKMSEEYAAEFQNPNTTPERKQEIRDIQNGLLPPELVPMT